MPTVTGTTTSIQMADPINHSALVFSTGLGGTSSTAFSRQNVSAGTTWSFQGTGFGGYSGGIPSFGTVTSVTVTGATSVTITGLSFPVASFFSLGQFELLEAVFAGADTINGSSTGDSLTGYGGTNTLFGNDGDDLLHSRLGVADTLDGGSGVDQVLIERLSGASVSISLAGMETEAGVTLADGTFVRNVERFWVITGSGDDTLTLDGPFTATNIFNGGGGVDRIVIDLTGSGESWSAGQGQVRQGLTSTILTLQNVEILEITGGDVADELRGGAFNDTLSGGDGNDAIFTGAGVDIVDGGAGTDRLELNRSATAVGFTLNTGDLATNAGVTLADGSIIRNIEHYRITSGSGADTFNITALPAIIPLGASFIDGGAGFDTLTGDFSSSTTPVNHHLFWFNFESVHVIGGSAGDTLNGGSVNSELFGGAGDDQLSGSAAGVDLLDGGAGFDRVNVGLGGVTSDVVFTLQNFDTPTGVTFVNGTNVRNAESIFIFAGSGNDTLDLGTAFSGNHGFNGGAGFDTVIADFTGSSGSVSTGSEFIRWGSTTSVLLAGIERYVITGGSGEDSLVASETAVANDILNGGAGNDGLVGYLGDDILNGGDGDDDIFMHSGADQIDGGAGNDRLDFIQRSVSQTFQLSDFIGFNTVDGAHFASGTVVRNMETLWAELSDANDTVIVNTDLNVRTEIWAHGGFDVLQLDLSGETRAVAFTLMPPTDWSPITFDAQPGEFWVGAVEQLVATLGSGADTVTGRDNNDTINGAGGADILDGGAGADLLDGDAGDDTLAGEAGNDALTGGSGDDVLYGGSGTDTIHGGEGRDVASFGVASDGATWSRDESGVLTVTSVDGVDTVTNTEVLRFFDRDVLIDRPARSFSGNGTSDILFRRDDGIMASWEVTGTTIAAASFLPTAGAEWSALGTGDFNGDGRDDVLWQRNDGLIYTWHMNGGTVQSSNAITGIGAEWSFLGVGDFNGDLRDDIAWQRNDGVVFIWRMNGAAIEAANAVTGLPAVWQIAGLGDFNSDGRDDFLWRNASTGQTVIWHMNGSTIQSPGPTSEQAGLDWAVVGVGDTNGDGRDDVILQRASDGMIQIWAMDGTNVMSATDVNAADPAQWTVRGIGDYNGDGRDDILWQNDNGLVYVWLMNGASIQSAGALSGIGSEWGII